MFGLIILRWRAGFQAFEWFGDKAVGFLDFTSFGSDFVFGEQYGFMDHGKLPSWMKHGFVMQVPFVSSDTTYFCDTLLRNTLYNSYRLNLKEMSR